MTKSIPANWLPGNPSGNSAVSNAPPVTRLCFQVAASAIAWLTLGATDVLITWRACIRHEPLGAAPASAGTPYFVMTGLLLCLTILAGTMSYRSWHGHSGVTSLLSAEGRERSEFLSMAGLYISFTLGAGIIWLGIPLFILEMCERTR